MGAFSIWHWLVVFIIFIGIPLAVYLVSRPRKRDAAPSSENFVNSAPVSLPQAPKSTNYFASHWRGENSLAFSYWVNGFLFNAGLAIVINILTTETRIVDDIFPFMVMAVGASSIMIWSYIGIWRSAGNSILRADESLPKRSAFWAYAARVAVVFGLLGIVGASIPVSINLIRFYKISENEISR